MVLSFSIRSPHPFPITQVTPLGMIAPGLAKLIASSDDEQLNIGPPEANVSAELTQRIFISESKKRPVRAWPCWAFG